VNGVLICGGCSSKKIGNAAKKYGGSSSNVLRMQRGKNWKCSKKLWGMQQ